jgi:hypothetical protein
MARPLEGITIADFSHVMAGPYASHLLCLLGATVIKIEEPGRGDAMRYYGDDRRYDGMSPAFIAVNAGKKSIALNLKDAADLETARRIVTQADVVLENFRPGVMKRLGLDYETCKSLNTDIIYCSVSGYGQSASELRDWPAIDNIVQATSGMMSLGGESGDPPVRVRATSRSRISPTANARIQSSGEPPAPSATQTSTARVNRALANRRVSQSAAGRKAPSERSSRDGGAQGGSEWTMGRPYRLRMNRT